VPAGFLRGCLMLALNLMAGCGGNDLSQIHAISARIAAAPVEKSKDVAVTFSDSAKIKAVLTAPLFDQYHTSKPYEEMAKGVHIDFYGPKGTIDSRLDANYGIRYENEKKVMVRNDVRVLNKKGELLNTEQLWWDEDKKKIYTDKYVKFKKSDGTYEGDGLDADETFTHVVFRKFRGMVVMKNDSLTK